MNDLPFASQTTYVDDTKVNRSFSLSDSDTTVTKLKEDFASISLSWCCENHLINPAKIKFFLLSGSRHF